MKRRLPVLFHFLVGILLKKTMQSIIQFLQQLRANNNREWFHAHKDEYKAVQAQFHAFADKMIGLIAQFDPSVAGLTTKEVTYRIQRDTRFSADKSPYKGHMGLFIARGGKKSGYSGYYFQLGAADNAADFGSIHWESQHIIAPGHYCIEPKALRILREDIMDGEGDFDKLVREVADERFQLLRNGALKRNPKGFPADAPWSEYLRLKAYCLAFAPTTEEVVAPDFPERLAHYFSTATPFLHYINRAIDYAREEE